MGPTSRTRLLAAAVVAAAGLNFSCSTETGPQAGTPAFHWATAKESFAANDYAKTIDTLDKIVASNNEYTARAMPWLLVLTSGTIRGYMDLADGLETGIRVKKADPGGFRKYVSNSRATAGRLSLHFAETFMNFRKGSDDPVILAFGLPRGSAAPVPELTRVANGMALQTPEIESAQRHATERAILLEACRAAGAPDDTAKAGDLFKTGEVKVPRATFIAAMSNALYEQGQLYGPTKLDDPTKGKMFTTLASEAMKGIPETGQTKELGAKIQKAMLKK